MGLETRAGAYFSNKANIKGSPKLQAVDETLWGSFTPNRSVVHKKITNGQCILDRQPKFWFHVQFSYSCQWADGTHFLGGLCWDV